MLKKVTIVQPGIVYEKDENRLVALQMASVAQEYSCATLASS